MEQYSIQRVTVATAESLHWEWRVVDNRTGEAVSGNYEEHANAVDALALVNGPVAAAEVS